MEIRLAKPTDIEALCAHYTRHGLESGRDGDLIFDPEDGAFNLSEDQKAGWLKKWSQPPTEIGWQRCWVAVEQTKIFGALKLVQQIPLSSALHRATLMMGLERKVRGQGYGAKLMTEALQWARLQQTLEWIDLGVFAHNQPAQRLYKKFGFQEAGQIPDRFRVKGERIDDIQMILKLRVG